MTLAFTQHPIARAELRYQRYIIKNSRARRIWIWLAYLMIVPAFLLSAGLYLGAVLNSAVGGDFFATRLGNAMLVAGATHLLGMNIALYVVVTLITVGLAANSITREKQSRTWESLLLTNVDARQMIFGKWWATLRALWLDHTYMLVMRLGILAWPVALQGQAVSIRFGIVFDLSDGIDFGSGPFDVSGEIIYLLLAVLFVILITVFDAAFSAALGMTAPVLKLPAVATLVLMLGLRIMATLFLIASPALLLIAMPGRTLSTYLGLFVLGLALYALLSWLLLRAAQSAAVHWQNVLPPRVVD